MKTLENVDDFIAKSRYSILVKKFGLPYCFKQMEKSQ